MKVTINGPVRQQIIAETAHVVYGQDPPDDTGKGQPSVRTKLFLSYTRKDDEWLRKLQSAMTPHLWNGTITPWWDGRIQPGDHWQHEIDEALLSSKAALLMISPNYLESDYIRNYELPQLLAASNRKEIRLLWVLVQSCPYQGTGIAELQAIHDIRKPLQSLPEHEVNGVLVEVCQQITTYLGP